MTSNWPMDEIEELLARNRILLETDGALLSEVGSTAYGTDVGGSDLDLTLVRVETWDEFVNGPHSKQSMMVRTKSEGQRSEQGDLDINVYTLRKFATLLSSGNPSVLAALYSPTQWHGRFDLDWYSLGKMVASQKAGTAFKGYMKQQLERWQGKRGQKNVSRPELVAVHGYDTKYASHVARLGLQGIQYMKTGELVMPLDELDADIVKQIRLGFFPEIEAVSYAKSLDESLTLAIKQSTLPHNPDGLGIDRWLAEAYGWAYDAKV